MGAKSTIEHHMRDILDYYWVHDATTRMIEDGKTVQEVVPLVMQSYGGYNELGSAIEASIV